MNPQTSIAFMEKMMEAKKLEMEAIMLLLPDKMKGHIEVIGNEVKLMLKECLLDMAAKHGQDTAEASQTPGSSKVKKVDIG